MLGEKKQRWSKDSSVRPHRGQQLAKANLLFLSWSVVKILSHWTSQVKKPTLEGRKEFHNILVGAVPVLPPKWYFLLGFSVFSKSYFQRTSSTYSLCILHCLGNQKRSWFSVFLLEAFFMFSSVSHGLHSGHLHQQPN